MPDQAPDPNLSLWDVYQAVLSLDRRMLSVEGAVKAALDAKTDHETRIRGAEKWSYAIPASILTAISAIAVAVLNK